MALPQDFWQNEHMFHRFRSKPCQRLLRSGLCEWHSQCQFSHDPEWPRRAPSKYNYSAALCPHIRPVMMNNSEVHLENTCPNGFSCAFSHTKDEVLYHPNIFKTSLCEEHRSLTNDQRSARRSKHRPRCHRYYCPFAHGKQELRSSPLTEEQRDSLVRAIGIFPNPACCGICTLNTIGPVCMENSGMGSMGYGATMPMVQEASTVPSQLWPGSNQAMLSQMVLPVGGSETTTSDISEGHVWGASPWMQQQQPLQQVAHNHANVLNEALHAMTAAPMLKEQPVQTQAQLTQENEAGNAALDVDSEIYERAVRFIEELSTEESDGSEDAPLATGKAGYIQSPPQAIKEAGLKNGASDMWNPQEAGWDANGQERWGQDPNRKYWAM